MMKDKSLTTYDANEVKLRIKIRNIIDCEMECYSMLMSICVIQYSIAGECITCLRMNFGMIFTEHLSIFEM